MAHPEEKTLSPKQGVGAVVSLTQQDNGEGLEALPPSVAPSTMLFPHCKCEFKNAFALGGHIRIHKTKIRFKQQRNKRKRQDLHHEVILLSDSRGRVCNQS